jgi:DUF1365 family protein
MHHRFSPKEHRFDYRIFLMALDLDELAPLARRLALFSVNRRNVYSFNESDYLPTGTAKTLKARVAQYAAERGVDLTGGRVLLLTLPRVFGYAFNPVSFYFCFDRSGDPVATIVEVTNTFKEMKPYWLGPESATARVEDHSPRLFAARVPKHFYVSPYSDVDVAFDFALRPPTDTLAVRIDDYAGTERTLTSTLAGPRRPLTDARLAGWLIKYPLLTVRVIALIHWHALRLWLKRIPWFAKSARASDQRGLFRPHRSIAPAIPPL